MSAIESHDSVFQKLAVFMSASSLLCMKSSCFLLSMSRNIIKHLDTSGEAMLLVFILVRSVGTVARSEGF